MVLMLPIIGWRQHNKSKTNGSKKYSTSTNQQFLIVWKSWEWSKEMKSGCHNKRWVISNRLNVPDSFFFSILHTFSSRSWREMFQMANVEWLLWGAIVVIECNCIYLCKCSTKVSEKHHLITFNFRIYFSDMKTIYFLLEQLYIAAKNMSP